MRPDVVEPLMPRFVFVFVFVAADVLKQKSQ